MKEIRGDAKSIRALLSGSKFSIDYYQREYRWEKKQVTELLDDLCEQFLKSHESGNDRRAVESYGHYFLGSIIISDKDGQKFIIDGQQRLTSMTLLLIHIYNQLEEADRGPIADLIFSQKFGKRSFNLDVQERTACMEALFKKQHFEESNQPESVVNILARYRDIEGTFPDEISDDTLPYFADWLIENVHLIEITARSDADAYTIFETMNDRGLSLTPTDMLKGYLLTNIRDRDHRNQASIAWRERIAALQKIGKDEDAYAIKAWLRSQYAKTIRERKRNAEPEDFDLIGTEFHRWVRDKKQSLDLDTSPDFARFIIDNFTFYGRWYEHIYQAAEALAPRLEAIHYNAQNNFTLQYPVLLAPLVKTDSEEQVRCKLRIAATFLDILIARRIWNGKSTSYSTMQYNMFRLVILKIRRKSIKELAKVLTKSLREEEETFTANERFSLHGRNGSQIHHLLARLTEFVETQAGRPSHYAEYIQRSYEVEHIWADRYERHKDEFSHPKDFEEYRNHIGGLLLLPKSFNASYGDMPYAEKLEHYYGQNLLARSLNRKAYRNDPDFKHFRTRFHEQTGIRFRSHPKFKKADLDARQKLYCALAEQIWNPDKLERIAEGSAA